MSRKTNRLVSLALALAFTVSLAACSGNQDPASSDVEIIYEYVDEFGNPITPDSGGGETAATTGSSGEASASPDSESPSGPTASGKTTSRSSASSQSSSAPSQSGQKPATGGKEEGNGVNADAEDYRGATVRYATWKDPDLNEDGVAVDSFEKEYGINVEIDMIEQDNYLNLVTGRIAAGQSPDVVFCTGTFPGILSLCQPLDAAKIDYDNEFWDHSMFEASTINGKTYLINAVGSIWNEVDCLFYSKSLLKRANCYTPEEYAAQGKWTWDAMEQIMRAVDGLGSQYWGGSFDVVPLVASTGSLALKYEDGKFSNGMSSTMTEAYRRVASWFEEGIASTNTYDFRVGNSGLCIVNAFGLKKTGFFFDSNWSDIGCYYLPDFTESHKATPVGIFRAWGIAKGAENPVAAGLFLRHYLDVDNYDISDAFINTEAERFFFELTAGEDSKKVYYFENEKQSAAITGLEIGFFDHTLPNSGPDQVPALLEAQRNAIDNAVNNLNNYLANIR